MPLCLLFYSSHNFPFQTKFLLTFSQFLHSLLLCSTVFLFISLATLFLLSYVLEWTSGKNFSSSIPSFLEVCLCWLPTCNADTFFANSQVGCVLLADRLRMSISPLLEHKSDKCRLRFVPHLEGRMLIKLINRPRHSSSG
jgi:hypothetical protein